MSTARSAHARQGRRRSVGTTTRSRLGARSAGVAGAGSDRAEPAMQRKRRGDVTRHTAHTTRECVCVCRRRDRRTHDKVGGARSARRLARGSALARRASPVSALTEPSRRCNARSAAMSLDTRRTRHESACACVDGAIGARTTRSAALGRHADSLAARRSLGGRRRCRLRQSQNRRCDARGAEMSLDTQHTRHGERVCRRDDRRTHDEVDSARSTRPLARGSTLARRRRFRFGQSRTGESTQRARGAVMSLGVADVGSE